MSGILSIRITPGKKEVMREVNVDWASFVRRTMEGKAREEKRKNMMKLMDESRRKTQGVKFDPAEVVRSLRDVR
ncbi:hypothetical protein C5S39_05535 [Candidatus Methanophagaceae archaeon]|nr:hypothetical protein C5S39_05535 [Methanophagales archaeon]